MNRITFLAAILLGSVSAAIGGDCVFVAPNGYEASFEPGYLVIDQGSDDRWCQAQVSPQQGGIAECPSEAGLTELEYSFEGSVMKFDGLIWQRRCDTPT